MLPMRDVITGLVCCLVGAVLLAWMIPAGTTAPGSLASPALSPAFWPRVLSVILLIAGGALVVHALCAKRAMSRTSQAEHTSTTGATPRRLWISVVLLVPYYIACLSLGLLLPSIAACGAYAVLAGERHYLLVAVYSVVMPALLTLFFIHVANVLVPLGPLSWLL